MIVSCFFEAEDFLNLPECCIKLPTTANLVSRPNPTFSHFLTFTAFSTIRLKILKNVNRER